MTTPPSSPRRRPARPARAPRPTTRPRRVAGTGAPRPAAEWPSVAAEAPVEPPVEPPAEPPAEPPVAPGAPSAAEPAPSGPRWVTVTLAGVSVELLALGATEIWYLQRDRSTPAVAAAPSTQMPVVLSDLETRSVVEQAAQDATDILSVSWRTYDEQVKRVSSMMTPGFAQQYASTRHDIRKPFIKQRTTVTTQIDNQGVISASPSEVDVLLYLTESTTKQGDGLTVQQFRVTVTMTRTASGWLVAKLDTT